MIKNIIFDFDGVIVDSEILVAKAFSKYLGKKNINFSANEFSIFAGKKTVQIVAALSQKYNIENKEKFFEEIMTITKNIYLNELTAIEGVKNFLQNANLNYFIGSNSVKNRIMAGIKTVKFESFFSEDRIYSFDMIKKPKPDPAIYLAAIEANKLNKKETIIIEDSAVGVKAGVLSGVKVVGLTAGGHWYLGRNTNELIEAGASFLVDNYTTLLKKITKL